MFAMKNRLAWSLFVFSGVLVAADRKIPNAAVNRAVWVANATYTVDQNRSYEQSELVGYLLSAYQKNPNLSADQAVKVINDARRQIVAQSPSRDIYDVATSSLTVLGTNKEFSDLATVAKEAVSWAKRSGDATDDSYSAYSFFHDWGNKKWEQAFDLAASNPRAAAALDRAFGSFLNAKHSDDAKTIQAHNPGMADHQAIKAIFDAVGPDGSLTLSVDQLTQMVGTQYGELTQALQQDRQVLTTIDRQQQVLLAFVANQQQRQQAEAAAAHQRELDQLKLDAANSGVYLLSTFATLGGNAKLGKEISVVGSSAIQVPKPRANAFAMPRPAACVRCPEPTGDAFERANSHFQLLKKSKIVRFKTTDYV
jgi:hypothetical protein